jgi:competence protein ComEC
MIDWKQYPFVKMLIPLCLGILANISWFPLLNFNLLYLLFSFTFAIIILTIASKHINYNYRWISGFVVSVLLFFIGFALVYVNNELNQKNHFSKLTTDKTFYQVKITESIEIKENSVKAIASVNSCKTNKYWQNCKGSLIIYFEKNNITAKLNYGDLLLVYGELNEIQSPRNPHEFNYKRYLANKNIYYQTYLKTNFIKIIKINQGNPIKALAINLRTKFLRIFEENGMNGREYAVISAILLGQTDKIDPELYKAYSGSGALHVLSVSGMHVGIVFISLTLFLSFLNKLKNGNIIKAFHLLIAVWFYAMLTGLSPSVIRASTMISFIIIGKALKRDSNIVNILSASGFVILCFNPNLLLEVGFQLSFLAVLGIVLFHELFYKLWLPENKLIDKIWSVTCVSIAAQIITTPLALYYFHQFPNYFLLTNIIVFIFAGVIIYAGIFVIIVSFIPYLSTISAKILVWMIFAMNESISFIEGLPFSVSRSINYSYLEAFLLYSLLISIVYAFVYKNKKLVFSFLIILLIMVSIDLYSSLKINKQKRFIVYSIAKTSAYDFFYGENQIMLADSFLKNDNGKIGFHIQNNRIVNDIKTQNFIDFRDNYKNIKWQFEKRKNFIQFNDKKIVIIEKKQKYIELKSKINLDYLILTKNCNVKISDLIKVFKPKLIIFDSSNKLWKTQKWEAECKLLQLNFYNVFKEGAYISDF